MGTERIPLFHIDGSLNIADLLTKHHDISRTCIDIGSPWQVGLPWMSLETEEMPLMKYTDLTVDRETEIEVKTECFDEPFLSGEQVEGCQTVGNINLNIATVTAGRENANILVNPIEHGWFKTIRIISYVLAFILKLKHNTFHKQIQQECEICKRVINPTSSSLHSDADPGVRLTSPCIPHSEMDEWDPICLESRAEEMLFRYESSVINKGMKASYLSRFQEIKGILYYCGRLTEENPFRTQDLDDMLFLDMYEFAGKIPVVMMDSPILYSFLIEIHLTIRPHAGVERTVKEVAKKMYVPEGVRKIIKSIKEGCSKCKIINKKTVEL